jgi:hypothetical protein
MPGGINRVPDGVAGFLGIKNFGRMPDSLNETLAGTWDLARWYLNGSAIYGQTTGGAVVAGSLATFIVPTNEVWYVTNYSVTVQMNAASSSRSSLVRFQNAGLVNFSVIGGFFNCAALELIGYGIQSDQEFLLAPGEVLGVSFQGVTGTGTFGTQLRYRSMPA